MSLKKNYLLAYNAALIFGWALVLTVAAKACITLGPKHVYENVEVMLLVAQTAAVMEVLDENRHRLVDLLAEHLPGSRYRMPDATYLAWIDCSHLGEGAVPRDIFRERGVEVSPGPQFGSEGSGHVRLNMATSPAVLERIVTAMGGG